MMLYMYFKYESSGPCSFRKEKIFENCIFENLIVDPMTYLCNQTELFEYFFVVDHPGIIPVEFGQSPISGSKKEVV